MRAKRSLLVVVLLGSTVLAVPTEAAANGGSYLELDQTHYLAGDRGVASTYIRVPEGREHLFELGPFYLFALPQGARIAEGKPIPEGAVRIGTFTIEEAAEGPRHWYTLRAAFSAPDFGSDFFEVALCNDPCTIAGFREPLLGAISIVATSREAKLLTQNDRLWSRFYGMRQQARRAERRLEAVEEDLERQLSFGASERARMSSEIERLEAQLAASEADLATARERVRSDPWVVGGIVVLALVAAALAFRRRRLTTVGSLDGRAPDQGRDDAVPAGASSPDGANGHRRAPDRIWARPR